MTVRRRAILSVLVLGVIAGIVVLAIALLPAQARAPVGIVRPDERASVSPDALGAELYAGNCASCHGIDGRGVTGRPPALGVGQIRGRGPSLRGVGALAPDFYLRTGYMPLDEPGDQPMRSRVLFREREVRALVSYIASLDNGPSIPNPALADGSLNEGLHLFTEHCAGCHQVVGQGGVVTGARVPPLDKASATQIAEAVRVGPYVMPAFPRSQISDAQLNSIVRYVVLTQHADNSGGWGIGNLGPVPEGLVSWLIAAGLLVGVCVLIGKRSRA